MHSYDLEDRGKVVASLTVLSLTGAWLAHFLLATAGFSPHWLIGAPSFVTIYGLLYLAYDRLVWKLGMLRTIGLASATDLSGTWNGEVHSSFGADGSAVPVTVTILQRWSQIAITLDAADSRSTSYNATLRTRNRSRPELSYQYMSQPRGDTPETMQTHRGTVILELTEHGLDGDYYTGRGRQTYGRIMLQRR